MKMIKMIKMMKGRMMPKKAIDKAVAEAMTEKKVATLATIRKWAAITGIVIAVCGALWGSAQAAIYYHLDERYVQVASYVDAKKQERVAFLNDQIFILNFKVSGGSATNLERALLEKYRNELRILIGH